MRYTGGAFPLSCDGIYYKLNSQYLISYTYYIPDPTKYIIVSNIDHTNVKVQIIGTISDITVDLYTFYYK